MHCILATNETFLVQKSADLVTLRTHTLFIMNDSVYLNGINIEVFKQLQILSDNNWIRNHDQLNRKQILNHLAKLAGLAKWLSLHLRTKCSWVRIPLLALKLQIWRLLPAKSFLTFRQTIECRFTLNFVRDMLITYSYKFER